MIVCCRLFLCLSLMPPGVSGVLLKIMLSLLPVFWRIKVFIMSSLCRGLIEVDHRPKTILVGLSLYIYGFQIERIIAFYAVSGCAVKNILSKLSKSYLPCCLPRAIVSHRGADCITSRPSVKILHQTGNFCSATTGISLTFLGPFTFWQ